VIGLGVDEGRMLPFALLSSILSIQMDLYRTDGYRLLHMLIALLARRLLPWALSAVLFRWGLLLLL
jgi:hypothetical protein